MATSDSLISIIMPVYNAKLTLCKIVDSIIAQTYHNWELISIDDGSTDGSGEILDTYAAKDQRISVIHKHNEGVSAARQTGLDAARGEYVIHVDSDDWVESEMLKELYEKACEYDADVVFCDYYINRANGEQSLIKQKPPIVPEKTLFALFQYLHGSCCNKLVKRACYSRYNISFPRGINYCEDLITWVQLFMHSEVKISYIPKAYYHYYYYSGSSSICHTYTKQMFNQQVDVLEKLLKILGNKYPEIINSYKMSIKCGAFENPIFSHKEYYSIFPELNYKIFKTDMSLFNKICMYLSYSGLYRLGTNLYKFKNQLLHS